MSMFSKQFDHFLSIGGTGMLADSTVALANLSICATVFGRNEDRLAAIKSQALSPEHLHAAIVDYRKPSQLQIALNEAFSQRGEFDLAVIWMHGEPVTTHQALKPFLGSKLTPCRLVWVLGSAVADQILNRPPAVPCNNDSILTQVILGFKLEPQGSRWLTHAEISNGVTYAVMNNVGHHIVGVVKPSSAHP